MSNEVPAVDEVGKRPHRGLRARSAGEVGVRDSGETHCLERDRVTGIDHRVEPRDDLRTSHQRGRDLDDRVVVGVETRGLDIDDGDLVFKTEDRLPRARGERGIRVDDR